MAPLISFMMILILSTLVIRVASVALTATGISRDIAAFQALSAFSGVGFTTSEAEHIINHPVRRRIITIVIRLGSLGLVTTITSLLLTFVNASDTSEQITRLVVLAVAISAFGLLAMSSRLDAHLTKVIQLVLSRWTKLNVYDYESMLRLTDGYSVGEMLVRPESWVANQTLADAGLHHEGVIVLGIYREDGTYIGAPRDQTALRPGDRLIIYGKETSLRELDKRLAGVEGDDKHQKAVSDQKLLWHV